MIARKMDKMAFFGVTLALAALIIGASSAAQVRSAEARVPSPPDLVDEEDTFDHDQFKDPKKMRVILGDTSGWVNPHDLMGSAQRRQKAKQQFLDKQKRLQKQLDEPVSVDTASSETRAELYSQIRARSAADDRTFSRLPVEPDDVAKEEPVVEAVTAPKTTATPKSCARCESDCKALKRDWKHCDNQLRALRLSQVVENGGGARGREFVYLRRLALNVVYSARYGHGEMPSNVKLEILLSPQDVASLEELAEQTETQSAQLEQQLSAILASSTVTPVDLPASSSDALVGRLAHRWASLVGPAQPFWAIPGLALLAVLAVICLRGSSWKTWVGASLLYLFLLSFVWHWVYSLQLETARRDAYVSRNIVPPEECRPGYNPGWLRWPWSDDQVVCDKYYEKLQVDPVWQVNPLLVAAEVLTKSFFHPLTFLGDYLGRFSHDFAKHQTMWSLFNILVSSVIVTVLIVVILMFLLKMGQFLWISSHGRERAPHRSRVEDIPEREYSRVTEGSKCYDKRSVLDRDRTYPDPQFDDCPNPDHDEEGPRFEDTKVDESTTVGGSGDAQPHSTESSTSEHAVPTKSEET